MRVLHSKQQNKSKGEQNSSVKQAEAIQAEAYIFSTPFQVSEAKRTVGVHRVSDWIKDFLYISTWLSANAAVNVETYFDLISCFSCQAL